VATEARPGIDIVVVNYKTPDDLDAFCSSVFNLEPTIPWTLTVVNVSPNIKDFMVADQAQRLGATHLPFEDNIGYARACNAGAAIGEQPIIALFNADVRLTPGAIDDCVHAMVANPTWGVLGPRQVDDNARMTHAGIFGTQDHPQHRSWLGTDGAAYADVQPAVTVSGAAYFIRRQVWDELTACPLYRQVADAEGAFLPTTHYFEETYCSYHAAVHGWEVIYFGPVRIIHRWHKASVVGGWAEQQFPLSQAIFRNACDVHGIPHD
jgi:GT2 family glycosyltransferase